ncbi:MAG: hypothetical protein II352_07575, partial [Selenomonadaceae bacterium]|nr:hypothetical protein [Selenomonadaceae bacterium]
DKPVVEVIQVFDCFFNRHVDGLFLLNTLACVACGDFLAYYGYASSGIAKLKMFLKTGNYAGGAVLSKRSLRSWQLLAMAGIRQMEKDKDVLESAKKLRALLPCMAEQNPVENKDDMKAVARLLRSVQ